MVLNISIAHHLALLNSTCQTSLATLSKDVDSTFLSSQGVNNNVEFINVNI